MIFFNRTVLGRFPIVSYPDVYILTLPYYQCLTPQWSEDLSELTDLPWHIITPNPLFTLGFLLVVDTCALGPE